MKNEWEDRGDHIAIKIRHHKYPATWALIDKEDFDLVNTAAIRWGPKVYKPMNTEYVRYFHPAKGDLYLHRVIMRTPKDMIVDHINHNGLDNRKSNLRNVTHKGNANNRLDHVRGWVPVVLGTTWKRGFSILKRESGRWGLTLSEMRGKKEPRRWGGTFDTKEEAETVGRNYVLNLFKKHGLNEHYQPAHKNGVG